MLTSVMVPRLSDSCKHQDITSKPGPGSLAKPEQQEHRQWPQPLVCPRTDIQTNTTLSRKLARLNGVLKYRQHLSRGNTNTTRCET